jgi:peptide/nickel transport system permease protein
MGGGRVRIAAFVLAGIVAACLGAPWYARWVAGSDPFRTHVLDEIEVAGRRVPVLAEGPEGIGTVPIGPGWRGAYALGADRLGRDVAARLLYGGRSSLLLTAAASALALALGLGLAVCSASRVLDRPVAAVVDLIWAFPVTLLAICLALAVEAPRWWLPAAILGVVFAPYVARPARAALLAVRAAPFIEAARATGASPGRVLLRHAVPQLAPLLAALAPVVAAMVLLTEAALSAIGLGVQPPGVSWGTLIAEGQALMYQRPMVAVAPGLAVVATVLALNALGEGVG